MGAREYRYGNTIIRVSRPELTENERIICEKNISIALQIMGKAMKEKENGNSNKSRNFKKK